MLLNTIRILLIFCLIATVCALKPTSTREKKSSTKAKPKRIGFLTACAIASNISPDLALNYGPKAYKAMKKRYERGKAHLKVKGKDGKLRNATKGEAIRINLSHPETYAVIEKNRNNPKQNEAIVAHPMLLNYEPPDPKDIRDTPMAAAHMPYKVHTPDVIYSPHDIYGGPSTQDVAYSTYGQPNTYTYEDLGTYPDVPEHTPHYPEQGPPMNEIPRSRAITDVTLWPGFWEQLPDGSWMEAYHIPYAFAEDSTFSTKDKQLIRNSMDKFAEKTCVRFTPTWYEGQHHIVINNIPNEGCCSWAGIEVEYNGNQSLNLETPACMDEPRRIHELIHATGIHHPQQRADRDEHIKVFWDNIVEEHKKDFQLFTNYLPPYAYDKRSVMHYQSVHGNIHPDFATVFDLKDKPIIHEYKVRQSDWHAINVNYQCDYYLEWEKQLEKKNRRN